MRTILESPLEEEQRTCCCSKADREVATGRAGRGEGKVG